eukprot:CAMPEP_0179706212 /NCGR_PEP_ID=MMETSP0937-20121108/4226_1 /TAXON_ID=548131 ORGANISM="Ostreococcus mediterraneus, Strain clade-D-RCC2593" /NCGR_SAMPLE_ID=MMETSP0937 /ASSEMBLY_ACC=CAM_ASM_000575 /LENGTH=126 /DNA_ID=CAMNT_0021579469 /DNA_START=578 /DNA_END=956 /DNA_ORIENTATION=-
MRSGEYVHHALLHILGVDVEELLKYEALKIQPRLFGAGVAVVAVAPPSLVPSVRAAPLFALAEPANTLCVPVVAVVVAAVVAENALCVNLRSASGVVDVPSPANAPSGPNPTSSSASTAFKNGLNS